MAKDSKAKAVKKHLTVDEIKANWSERLAKVNEDFDDRSAIQMRMDPEEVAMVLGDGVPEGMEDVPAMLKSTKRPTHVLLWREQVQELIDHDPRQNITGKPADV